MSCNTAAAHFGVGISTVINWVRRWREKGRLQSSQVGGYKPKAISGDYRVWLMQRIKERAFTSRGLVAELRERGLKVDYRSVSNFDRTSIGDGLPCRHSVSPLALAAKPRVIRN
jgi:putative transposase